MSNTQQALQQARSILQVAIDSDVGRLWNWPETAKPTFLYEVREAIRAIDAALSLPVEAPGDVKLPAELDAATLWLAKARDSLRKLADGANQHLTAVLHAALATPSAGIAGDAAHPMRDGYAGSTFISNASGHSLRIEYKTREQGDSAQAWLAGDAAPQEQPPRGNTQCNPHPDAPHDFDRYRSLNEDRYVCACEGWMPPAVHLASGASQSVREQAVWVQPDHLAKARKAPFLCRVEPAQRDDFVPLYASPLPVPTDDELMEVYRAHIVVNGSHSWINDPVRFCRSILALHQAHQKEGA